MKARAERFSLPAEPYTVQQLRSAAAEGGPFITPWPASFSMVMLRKLWAGDGTSIESFLSPTGHADARGCPGMSAFVNGREPTKGSLRVVWNKFRAGLELILRGKAPMTGRAINAPLWLVGRDDLVYFTVQPAAAEADWERPVRAWMFALMLLWHPAVRPLLRRCVACGRFDLLGRPKSTERRHFCDRQCRSMWERSEEGQRANAARQRAFRRAEKRRDRKALASARLVRRR